MGHVLRLLSSHLWVPNGNVPIVIRLVHVGLAVKLQDVVLCHICALFHRQEGCGQLQCDASSSCTLKMSGVHIEKLPLKQRLANIACLSVSYHHEHKLQMQARCQLCNG